MSKKRVLVVDDTAENVELLLELLSDKYDVMVALTGESAIELTKEELPDLILLDIMMPNMDGYRVCEILKESEETAPIPIIFLTAKDDEDSIEKAYSVGGVDYVSKPFKPKELFARIAKELKVQELIVKLQESQKTLELLSSTDTLTSLYNRRYFLQRAQENLEFMQRYNTELTLIMIDIDDFKAVNDTYGHNLGDEVLVSFSALLKELGRKSDVVCRWGGEEFVVLFPHTDIFNANNIAKKLQNALKKLPINLLNGKELYFTVSIGLTAFSPNDTNVEEPLLRADSAMYKSKQDGKNRISIF